MTDPYLRFMLRFSLAVALSSAFMPLSGNCIPSRPGLNVAQDIDRPPTFLDQRLADDDDLNIVFIDESDEAEAPEAKGKGTGRQRWENLNPKVKERLIKDGQQKAIANKKKREPAEDKKRRTFHFLYR
jgi:hypothetical protein